MLCLIERKIDNLKLTAIENDFKIKYYLQIYNKRILSK
jgi:hypothetical protein